MWLLLQGKGYSWFDDRGKLWNEGDYPEGLVEYKEVTDSSRWVNFWIKQTEEGKRKLNRKNVGILFGDDLVFKKLVSQGEKAQTVLEELLGEVPFSEGKKIGRIIRSQSGVTLTAVLVKEIPESIAGVLLRTGSKVRGVWPAADAGISGAERELVKQQLEKVKNLDFKDSWLQTSGGSEKQERGKRIGVVLVTGLLLLAAGLLWFGKL